VRALKAGASGYLTTKRPGTTRYRYAKWQPAKYGPALAEELANALGMDTEKPLHETLSDREFQTCPGAR
jgi:hypothetical protein